MLFTVWLAFYWVGGFWLYSVMIDFLGSFLVELMRLVGIWRFPQFTGNVFLWSSRLLDERNLILVIMRMSDQYLVDVHDYHKSQTGDDHCQRDVWVLMQAWRWRQGSFYLSKILVKSRDGLWNDVQHCDWQEQTARECHGHGHYLSLIETF